MVSGAYGYLRHYSPNYYKTLSSGVDEDYDQSKFPKQPNPDLAQIIKDIARTFSDEPFFQLKET